MRNFRRAQPRNPNIVFRLLPAGSGFSTDGTLQGSWGETVTFARASEASVDQEDGTVEWFATGLPRRTRGGVLVEGARTNVALRSQEFDNASWTKENVTVAANDITAPDGTATADKITDDTANAQHRFYQSITVTNAAATTYTVYAKAGTAGWIRLIDSGTVHTAAFNLSTGVVGEITGAGTTSSIKALANGWYRCALMFTASAGANFIIFNMGTTEAQTSPGNPYVGVGSTLYVWGAQAEASSAFASSHIRTVGSTVTRVADVASIALPATMTNAEGSSAARIRIDWTPTANAGVIASVGAGNPLLPYINASPTSIGVYDAANIRTFTITSLVSRLAKLRTWWQGAVMAVGADDAESATQTYDGTIIPAATYEFGTATGVSSALFGVISDVVLGKSKDAAR